MPSIIDTLQKLIAFEASARQIGNQAEAEAFAEKIQTLLLKHELTMSAVEHQQQEIDEPVEVEMLDAAAQGIAQSQRRQPWRAGLADAIAKSMMCKVIQQQGSVTLYFVGRKSNRKAAVEMFNYLSHLAPEIAEKEYAAFKRTPEFASRKRFVGWSAGDGIRWFKSFLLGFAVGVANRLGTNQAKMLEGNAAGTAMILRNNAALDKAVSDRWSKTRQLKSTSRVNSEAYRSGMSAGERSGNGSRFALSA